jgi:hypothetical protein
MVPLRRSQLGRSAVARKTREMREEEEARSRYHEAIRKTDAQRKQAKENAFKRAIERQKKEERHSKRRVTEDLETKLAMAKEWVEGLQHKYAEELRTFRQSIQCEGSIDLGWERRKDRQICRFCDVLVHEYIFHCPSGGPSLYPLHRIHSPS